MRAHNALPRYLWPECGCCASVQSSLGAVIWSCALIKSANEGLTTRFIAGRILRGFFVACIILAPVCQHVYTELDIRRDSLMYMQTFLIVRLQWPKIAFGVTCNLLLGVKIKHLRSVLYKKILTSPFICTRFV